jgi:hypothetical protein
MRRCAITIKLRPGDLHPRQVKLIVKLMQIFEQKSRVMILQVDNAQTSILLTSASSFPSY